MNPSLQHWTADEVAECLDISRQLSGKLWKILDDSINRTPKGGDGSLDSEGNETVETPDGRLGDNDDKANHWWSSLSDSEQQEINEAYEKNSKSY
jgi:hypothetical protein